MITVLADQHHYQLERFLHPSIRLETYDPLSGWSDEQARRADAILVRTTSPLNRQTLPDHTRLRFAGTASAGRDHLDEDVLHKRNIRIVDAKGSNARSVAEYVAVSVLSYCDYRHLAPETLTAGIVGAGFTGTATSRILKSIGIPFLLYDPPREIREREQHRRASDNNDPFRSNTLEEVLSCDILSFHVPLERSGTYATLHWYDEEKIRARAKKLVINASRGGVIRESALRKARREGYIDCYICDVWENEPVFCDETLGQAFLGTPHIAGYSTEAKRNASEMMCRKLHHFFGLPDPPPPKEKPRFVTIPEENLPLLEIIRRLHPAWSYDANLRKLAGLPAGKKGPAFLRLRQNTPLRNEFSEIQIPEGVMDQHPVLGKIGFRSAGSP